MSRSEQMVLKCVLIVQSILIMMVGSVSSQVFNVDEIKGPVCIVRDSLTGKTVTVSPEISKFNVVITNGLAHITLTQLFINPFKGINDIVYVFPLPHDGAVHAMSMEYNDFIYKAKIIEKTKAIHIYDSVVTTGGVAALLLQNRPNIFQQRLANIPQGDTAYIEIEVSAPLKYDNGEWELAIPTMVGERFQSQNMTYVPSSGTLWNPPAQRGGQSLQMNVIIQTGIPIVNLHSPSHALSVSQVAQSHDELVKRDVIRNSEQLSMPYNNCVLLQTASTYPNRDFILRFSRTEAKQDFSLASFYDYSQKKGYFSLSCFPDDSLFIGDRPDLEIVLLLDISGSQSGWPILKEKEIAVTILNRLQSTDRISVLSFNNSVNWCYGSKEPRPATSANVALAKTYIQGLSSSGGTNLLNGVREALSATSTTEHKRIYVFCTDGFITNESDIFSEIKNHPTHPTVFTFGAGNNLNRYFLDQAALVGDGFSCAIMQSEDVTIAVENAWKKIESPQLKNLTVSINTAGISNIIMPGGGSLYAGRALDVYGMYSAGGVHDITITGYKNGTPVVFSQKIALSDTNNCNVAIPKIWAKQKIEQMRIIEGTSTIKKDSIVAISIEHQILSKYTAFLAVTPVSTEDAGSLKNKVTAIDPIAIDRTCVVNQIKLVVRQGLLTIDLPENEHLIIMQVFDLKGRLIFSLTNSALITSSIAWDGTIRNGTRLKAGRYIVKIKTNRRTTAMPLLWK